MKILVGISGGVDSAFCANRLLLEGHEVEGAVLLMHEHTEIASAKAAAHDIGIKLHVVDVREEFEKVVKENFISEYLSGRTPNPCIICNEKVKFARLYSYAMENGFDAIATGHYAKIVKLGERYAVARSADEKKDQSYMLYRLPQNILSALILPLSDIPKADVRRESAEQGISAADRKDSQEICFLPDGKYAEFIEQKRGISPPGNFVDEEGNTLGRHNGIIRYTVGQRKGLGISLGERMFVSRIDPVSNDIVLSKSSSGKNVIELRDLAYSSMAPVSEPCVVSLMAKLRYTAPLVEATAELRPDGTATLRLSAPHKAAPGQSAVLYIDGVVALGGIIC